jgi:hypothetical protein
MDEPLARGRRRNRQMALTLTLTAFVWGGTCLPASASAEDAKPVRIPQWPCRLVVHPPLLGALEAAWQRSATLQRQCRDLADAGAVVILEWGKPDSQFRAVTRMGVGSGGVVVAYVSVPPVSEAVELVAHELEHVIEKAQGVNLQAESKRRGSGVWRAHGGFESQRAIDAGRQVAKEMSQMLPEARVMLNTTVLPPMALPAAPGCQSGIDRTCP